MYMNLAGSPWSPGFARSKDLKLDGKEKSGLNGLPVRVYPTWYTAISFGGQKWPIEFRGTDDNSNVQQKRPTTQIDNEKKILEAARKAKEILDSKKKEPEVTGLGLLVGQYR